MKVDYFGAPVGFRPKYLPQKDWPDDLGVPVGLNSRK